MAFLSQIVSISPPSQSGFGSRTDPPQHFQLSPDSDGADIMVTVPPQAVGRYCRVGGPVFGNASLTALPAIEAEEANGKGDSS
jgi:hypothetical protein